MKKDQTNLNKQGSVRIEKANEVLFIFVEGNILNYDSKELLGALSALKNEGVEKISVVNNGLKKWDSSLLLILFEARKQADLWHKKFEMVKLPDNLQAMLSLAFMVENKPNVEDVEGESLVERIGKRTVQMWGVTQSVLSFCSQMMGSLWRLVTMQAVMRKLDFLTALDACGPKAVGIVALISFLVGLILAYVGAVQLQQFGAQIYIASLVTIGMCRIMGAIMVGIVMAGRTGSAYAATIGTMQVNEELDALQTMGLSRVDFLVLPRLLAIVIAMPILTMLADLVGIVGGAFVGVVMMGLPYQEYYRYVIEAFNLSNFWVGIFHAFCFGIIIAICGCYQGLNCGRNADSVGVATTRSVVYAIVYMIVATGIITVICQEFGV